MYRHFLAAFIYHLAHGNTAGSTWLFTFVGIGVVCLANHSIPLRHWPIKTGSGEKCRHPITAHARCDDAQSAPRGNLHNPYSHDRSFCGAAFEQVRWRSALIQIAVSNIRSPLLRNDGLSHARPSQLNALGSVCFTLSRLPRCS